MKLKWAPNSDGFWNFQKYAKKRRWWYHPCDPTLREVPRWVWKLFRKMQHRVWPE